MNIKKKLSEAWDSINLNEAASKSLNRALHHFRNNDIAIMTAFRKYDQNGVLITKPENIQRNKILAKDIRMAGYGFIRVRGTFLEDNPETGEKNMVEEESFFIVDVEKEGGVGGLKDNVIMWGKKWHQDAVIFKGAGEDALLIGTNDTGYPGMGNEKVLGKVHINKPADFFTQLHGGRQFSFSEDVDMSRYESYMVQSSKESVMKRLYGDKK